VRCTRHSAALHHRVPNDFCLDVRRRRVHVRILYNNYCAVSTYRDVRFCILRVSISNRGSTYILHCSPWRSSEISEDLFRRSCRCAMVLSSYTRNNNAINNNYIVYYRVYGSDRWLLYRMLIVLQFWRTKPKCCSDRSVTAASGIPPHRTQVKE